MSLSAMPLAFRAAMTFCMAAEFEASAAFAVSASVATPLDMEAISGMTSTSPVADTVIVRRFSGLSSACAAVVAASRSPARRGLKTSCRVRIFNSAFVVQED